MERRIRMDQDEASALALQALVWILQEDQRASRFLGLTGLDAERLRATAMSPATHSAILDYLAAHEPDLLACADAINASPISLITAQALLSGGHEWG